MDMRISGVLNTYSTYATKKAIPTTPKNRVEQKTDSVSYSAVANEFNVARRAVSELPDVREAQVARLVEAVQSGTYAVSAAQVAARIFAAE